MCKRKYRWNRDEIRRKGRENLSQRNSESERQRYCLLAIGETAPLRFFSKVTLTPSKLHLGMVHYYLEVQTMSKMILIIEDEEAIQGVVKAFLEAEGYNVVLAGDGLEGWRNFVSIVQISSCWI